MIHFEAILWGLSQDSLFCLCIFNCSKTICWKGYLSFTEFLNILIKNQLRVYVWTYFWILHPIPWYMCPPTPQYSAMFISIVKYYSFISGTLIPYTLFFYIMITLTNLWSMSFHINFRISFSLYKNKTNLIEIF